MQVAQRVAGFSLAKADILRKAMSDKIVSLMASMKTEFINGGVANGFSESEAVGIFELIEKFANYGFNKAHSVAIRSSKQLHCILINKFFIPGDSN